MGKHISNEEWKDSQVHESGFWKKQFEVGNEEQYHRFNWYTRYIFGGMFNQIPWEEQSVLEIGSGPCGVVSRIACLNKVALDPLMDEFAKAGYHVGYNHTIPVCCDAESMLDDVQVTGYSYDHILCFNCLDHCRDPELVMRNIKALMLNYTKLWLVCDMRPTELVDAYHKIQITRGWVDQMVKVLNLVGPMWEVPHQTGNPTIQLCALLTRG